MKDALYAQFCSCAPLHNRMIPSPSLEFLDMLIDEYVIAYRKMIVDMVTLNDFAYVVVQLRQLKMDVGKAIDGDMSQV